MSSWDPDSELSRFEPFDQPPALPALT